MDDLLDPDTAVTLPELAHAGAKAGIASAHSYFAMRARLFPNEPQARLTLEGRYTLLDKLGEGAMGVVFVAFDAKLSRRVALKVLRGPGHAEDRARLLREAQNLAQLNHPHVIQIHEVGEYRGEVYIVMEYVEGRSLDAWLEAAKPGFKALLDVLVAVAEGLAAAHAQKIVHRDVKPANILVGDDGRVRLADFGLAWLDRHDPVTQRDLHGGSSMLSTVPSTMSQSGAGTPAYMSPEQIRREELDGGTDLYSYCVVVWEMVYGERPHKATNAIALSLEICEGKIGQPRHRPRGVPARLEQILRKGLATARGDRYRDMRALRDELMKIRHPRSLTRWVLAMSLGAGLAFAGTQAMAGTCKDLSPELDALWSKAAGELATSLHAIDRGAADAIVGRVDAFVRDLRQTRIVMCEQRRDARLNDTSHERARVCLDEREEALRSVLSALRVSTEQEIVATPEDVSTALGSIARCRDPRYLAASVDPPAPDVLPKLDAIRGLRRSGDAELLRGDFPKAAAIFADAVARAREVGYDPTTAEALYDLGRTELRLRRGGDAVAALREARILADGARDSFVAADASLLLIDAAVAVNDLGAAEWHEQEARARLRQVRRERGGLLGELELAHVDRLIRANMLDQAGQVLASAKELLTHDPPEVGLWPFKLPLLEARLAELRGDPATAAAKASEAWSALQRIVGSAEHPLYAEELGRHQLAAGKLAEAERSLERARAIYVRALGEGSPQVASVDVALARLHDKQGRPVDAARAATRADAVLSMRPNEPMTLDDRVFVAVFRGRQFVLEGRYADALVIFEGGLAALAGVDASLHTANFAALASGCADLHVFVTELRDLSRARERITSAMARFPSDRHDEDPRVAAFMLRVAADVALEASDFQVARAHTTAAMRLLTRAPDPESQARVEYALARALGPADPRALELATGAHDYFASVGQRENSAEVQAWIDGARGKRR